VKSCIDKSSSPDLELLLQLRNAQVDFSESYSSAKKANVTHLQKTDDFFTIWITPNEKIDDDVIPKKAEIEFAIESELDGMNNCFMKQEHPEKRLYNHYQDESDHLDILNIKLLDIEEDGNELEFRSRMMNWRSFHFHRTDVGSPIYCPIGENGEYRILGLITGKYSDLFI